MIIVYKVYVTAEVVKSKLITVILKEQKGFREPVLLCAKIARWRCCDADNFNTVFNY